MAVAGTGQEGAEALAARGVGARGAGGDRAAPEVILAEEYRRLHGWCARAVHVRCMCGACTRSCAR